MAIFGGALTLPILAANAGNLAQKLVTISFLFFGANTISCLFWLLRVNLPDQADLTYDLSRAEKYLLVFVGLVGHTAFNFAGLLLLAATTITYSYRAGLICIGFMSLVALLYICFGGVYVSRQMKWSYLF